MPIATDGPFLIHFACLVGLQKSTMIQRAYEFSERAAGHEFVLQLAGALKEFKVGVEMVSNQKGEDSEYASSTSTSSSSASSTSSSV